MPQMAPYNWLNLFILISMIFLHSSTYTHFIYTNLKFKPITYKKTNFSWIWKF